MISEEPTILIIGAGVFGASTAYHLAHRYKDASRITIIDRSPSPPDLAASTDINKIIRADYSSAFYAKLAYGAMEAWNSWPELKEFYHRTGWIMFDEKDSNLSERIREVLKKEKGGEDPTTDVELDDVENGRWGRILKGSKFDGFGKAYWNPEAGWCEAAKATDSIIQAAIKKGVRYVVGDVESIVLGDSGNAAVRTIDGNEFGADKLVLATGAWTSSLLSPVEDELRIEEEDRVERQAQAAGVAVVHYRMSSKEMEVLSDMPVVVYGEHGEVIPPPTVNHLLKYTNANTFTHFTTTPSGHKISVPPKEDQRIVPETLKREMIAKMCSRIMPTFSMEKEPAYWRICWDSYTPTQDWLLSKHPDPRLKNLYLAVGGSFHSYKFLPIIGKYMSNVLSGKGNGDAMDKAFAWKGPNQTWKGAHESTAPRRDLGPLLKHTTGDTRSKL